MDKVDMAIKRLQTASEMSLATYGTPITICISGGKDSGVLLDLAMRANIPIEVQHSHTTADAPETVYFIRKQMYELECAGICAHIDYPTYKGCATSLWKLMREKMMPPTRTVRYCCEVLKETHGKGRMVATGVRWDESVRRASKRGIYENHASKSKNKIVLKTDNDEDRRIFEQCNLKEGMMCNPIVDWTDREIWDYTWCHKLSVNPLYNDFGRVGCVGCPMAGKGRKKEFARWPKYQTLYLLAFESIIERRRALGKDVTGIFKNKNSLFSWWMEDGNVEGQISFDDEVSI